MKKIKIQPFKPPPLTYRNHLCDGQEYSLRESCFQRTFMVPMLLVVVF